MIVLKRAFLLALLLLILSAGSDARQLPPIPLDKQVEIGKLDNGLTCYIRENILPENRVYFCTVQKVDSILEEKNYGFKLCKKDLYEAISIQV